jgi:hypothetical protein
VRGQRVLHPRRLPRRRRLLPVVRPHRHRRRLQARDRRLLRQRQPRDHKYVSQNPSSFFMHFSSYGYTKIQARFINQPTV